MRRYVSIKSGRHKQHKQNNNPILSSYESDVLVAMVVSSLEKVSTRGVKRWMVMMIRQKWAKSQKKTVKVRVQVVASSICMR